MSARPIRTLHITNAWHPTSGGIRTFYRALLAQASQEGRALTLIVPAARTAFERAGRHGGIYYLRAPHSPVFDTRYRLLLPHRYLRPSVSAIWRILEREQPDIVEVCDKYALVHLAGLIKKRAGGGPRPTLVGLSCERMDDNVEAWLPGVPGGAALARQYMRRVYLPQFDAHIANSRYTAMELLAHADAGGAARRLAGLASRVHICPMGVEAARFSPARRRGALSRALRVRAGAADGDALLLYAGRVSPEKNVALLPAIARELSARGVRFRLLVAGDGPALDALRAAAEREAPGRVAFLGHLAGRDEIADVLASVDLFVHPNPREPFGIGPLEAMASGTPVIVPDAGGVLEYAHPWNAWLAQPSAPDFAGAIERALRVDTLRHARAHAGLQTASAFDWPVVASRMLATYDRIHRARHELNAADVSQAPLAVPA